MDTKSPRSRRFAISTFPRLLIALAIVVAAVSIEPALSSTSKVPPRLPAFWISSSGTSVTLKGLQNRAKVVVSCMSGCRGSEKIKVGRHHKVSSKLLARALRARHKARIRVQETKGGFNGVWKIAVIKASGAMSSLPSPIKVYCLKPRTKSCRVIKKAIGQSTKPANTDLPTISGTAKQGQSLTTANGSWTNSPTTYAYQWRRCNSSGASCSNIASASASTYTLKAADVGATIRVVVTATNSHGSASASSARTAVVVAASAPSPPTNTALPAISGTAKQGQSLTASQGSWSNTPSSYVYQWQRCNSSGSSCANISSATPSTYTLQAVDVDATIRVSVTASNSYGSASAVSHQTVAVATAKPVNLTLPAPSGTAVKQGVALTASNGTWNNTPSSYTYQWQSCSGSCSNISSATAGAYTPDYAKAGSTIRVVVTATNSFGSTSANSAQTAVVEGLPPANSNAPTISGTAQQGQSISKVSDGVWSNSPTYTYQWQRLNGSWSNIGGATSSSYTLTAGDVGYTIRLAVTATNPYGAATAYSTASGVVAPLNTGAPSISGAARYTQTLSVSNGTWGGATGLTFSYQWQRCAGWVNVGANSTQYTAVAADVGSQINVVVTASINGASTSAPSGCYGPVADAYLPTNTSAPVISRSGSTLSTTNGGWSGGDPLPYSYVWKQNTNIGSSMGHPICNDSYPSGSWTVVGGNAPSMTALGLYCYAVVVTVSNAGGSVSAPSIGSYMVSSFS